ncbi:hypothetical protein E1B28_010026 [Marasmius oreades]|uniref:Uncharacterized protein n=1 Tax=Marasmius oreades TaxID=181124 RepID=A0A9P7RXQ9_9AGAR|nr:uncharacterized protein E1B28_010026 [Marasmius oreades]KAG7090958.1 hypothetical protein E1B28_010026 [Marasmius oreades]
MTSAFASFGCLDEVIQVIYQGADRFVLLSFVNNEEWSIKLGLAGTEGRWWNGSWVESDIFAIVGSKPSATVLEKFSQKLADSLVQGELFISNWSPESSNASIKLTFAPGSIKPMHMSLTEISADQAASFASEIFLEIAIKAKSRQCRLHDPGYAAPGGVVSTASPSRVTGSKRQDVKYSSDEAPDAKPIPNHKRPSDVSRRKVQELSPDPEPKSKSVKGAPRPIKGASLANPNKKARKYQAIEFGSDEE